MKINNGSLYITDNGRTLCGGHLGMTAKMTGRDLSGQRIHKVTPADIEYNKSQKWPDITCEDCTYAK